MALWRVQVLSVMHVLTRKRGNVVSETRVDESGTRTRNSWLAYRKPLEVAV